MSHRRTARALTLATAASAVVLSAVVPAVAASGGPTTAPAPAPAPTLRAAAAPATPKVFAYYYLWWSAQHWHDKLGNNYPYSASPLPLPATADSDGCNPVSQYAGNQLTDVPTTIQDQDAPGVIENDVRQAAAAHLTGFVVNWIGTGSASQTADSVSYSRRLAALVTAVHKVNAEGTPFSLVLSLKSSATILEHDVDHQRHLLPDPHVRQRLGVRPQLLAVAPPGDLHRQPEVLAGTAGHRGRRGPLEGPAAR